MLPVRDLITDLPRILEAMVRPGDYFGTGELAIPVVRISVDGVGVLGLPVPTAQARELVSIATDAPYGRGSDTIVDPAVRRCRQIEAAAVRAMDPRWQETLRRIVEHAKGALGAEGEVEAQLYKALVYEPGGFFVEHRDTEKTSGMFATLVVVLPSAHEGGELVIRHDGREESVALASDDLGVVRWAAFYADCRHEVRPIRAGYRISLVYNLVRRSGELVRVPDSRDAVAAVGALLRAWGAPPEAPTKIVYPLAHHYTPAELGFEALKNEDAAAAQVLARAAQQSGCRAHLAMISIRESGSAEPIWHGSYHHRFKGEADAVGYDVIDLDERTCTMGDWRSPSGCCDDLGPIEVEEDELAPADALADEDPDEDHLHEATGNEGATFERTYRRAALVVWPEAHELRVIAQGGAAAAVAALERFSREPDGASRVEALAGILGGDSDGASAGRRLDAELRARVMRVLSRLRDRRQLLRFLHDVVAAGGFDGSETADLVTALGCVSEDESAAVVRDLAHQAAPRRFGAVAQLLREIAENRPGQELSSPIEELVAMIPRSAAMAAWERPSTEERVRGIIEVIRAADLVGAADAASRLGREVLAHGEAWQLDEIVIPALRGLPPTLRESTYAGIHPLLLAARDHLRARIALPLAPAADAKRETDGLACSCTDCQALCTFLRDPVAATWRLRAAQARRSHVEHAGRAARIDVDTQTERRGSPHTLICTKNEKRYHARVKQRSADQEALAALESWDFGRVDTSSLGRS